MLDIRDYEEQSPETCQPAKKMLNGNNRRCCKCGTTATHLKACQMMPQNLWLVYWFCSEHQQSNSQPIENLLDPGNLAHGAAAQCN